MNFNCFLLVHYPFDAIRFEQFCRPRSPCTKRFLSQIYLEFPQVILTENWRVDDLTSGSDENTSSVLDTVSHILLNAVANVQSGKEWARKVTHEFELCLRKLASVHPMLMLRYF